MIKMKKLKNKNSIYNGFKSIKHYIDSFKHERKKDKRYASFDYCYNYFYTHKNKLTNPQNIQMSCLQLGFFLASWGMFRNPELLEKSLVIHQKIIIAISRLPKKLWYIDVNDYNDKNIKLLTNCINEIIKALKDGGVKNPTDGLVTKIMLGVFANVPAFDSYFKAAYTQDFKEYSNKKLNELSFDRIHDTKHYTKMLLRIKKFYENHKDDIDSYPQIKTFDFLMKKSTEITYTKAKLIDMYGWKRGKEIIDIKEELKKKKSSSNID